MNHLAYNFAISLNFNLWLRCHIVTVPSSQLAVKQVALMFHFTFSTFCYKLILKRDWILGLSYISSVAAKISFRISFHTIT